MQIRDVRIYIRPGEPQARSVGNRGGMEKAPPGLSGLFTHAAGFGAPPELPAGWLQANPLSELVDAGAKQLGWHAFETPRAIITPLTAFSAPRCASEHNSRRFRPASCLPAIFK